MILNEDGRLKIWMDYVVTIVGLNNHIYEYDINAKVYTNFKTFPILGIITAPPCSKHIIRSFDDFCSDSNELRSDTLLGWYSRKK